MKHARLLVLSLLAVGLTGCGTLQATGEASAPSTEPAAPIDAALVTSTFGWVLTPDRLLVTTDGGATFAGLPVPVPTTQVRAAHFRDARNGYVLAASGAVITVARTADGGRTWRTSTLRGAAGTEFTRLRADFGDAAHGVVLARTSAGAMSSTAIVFATENGGSSWSARHAPVAGEIAVEPGGRTWLAGGVAGDQLHQSADLGRHWSRADLRLAGPADATVSRTVAPPVGGVVPVTVVTRDDRTQVALLGPAAHGRWQETGRVSVRGRTGPGVRVPVVGTAAGPLVLDTAGGHAYRTRTAISPQDLAPSGLPEGADAVGFAPDGRTGWALATYGRCATGKTECTLYHPLLKTTDAGITWNQLRTWDQHLN